MTEDQDDPSLAEPYARLVRAREHVNALHEATEVFFKREGYAIAKEGEPEDGWETVVFEVREPPPLELSLILSDALHNWRAALDNLAWQLVRLNNRRPGGHTGFPVTRDPDRFDDLVAPRLHGMADRHKQAIANLQPYPGRNESEVRALEMVHALARADRHRALHATFASPAQLDIPFAFVNDQPGPAAEVDVRLLARGKLKHGTRLAQIRVRSPSTHPDMKVRAEPIFEVAFGERGLRLYAIPYLGTKIGSVVEMFAPDFPD